MSTTPSTDDRKQGRGRASRAAIFAYSVFAYAVGMASIAWLIVRAAGLSPVGGLSITATTAGALGFNFLLLLLFGVQHSIMARPWFKERWVRVIPKPAERSTFVLLAGLMLALVLGLWQPMPETVWSVANPQAAVALWSLFAFGWLYLVAATFVTNHFDLFGLRQAWLHLKGRPYTPVPFVRKWMYRYSRHPMMAGILLGLWATPHMRLDHLVLALGFSAYIAVGLAFEERELTRQFGRRYRQYRHEAGALLPRLRSASPAEDRAADTTAAQHR